MKLYIALLNLLCLTGFAFAQDKLPPRVVRVVGTAEVKVVPDRAVIELGVEKQDSNAAAAKAATDKAARQILAALRANGVDEKDMQTTYLALRPESYTRKGVRISYFIAEETLSITVRDLSKIDALLDALVRAGGNRIGSVSYETSDLRKYRDQARDLAVKAAREKATALAQALGQDVGKAYSIDEVADFGLPAGFFANAGLSYDREKERTSGPSLAPGQKTISASVTVSFDLN
jgi:uncharacterized protein YggE